MEAKKFIFIMSILIFQTPLSSQKSNPEITIDKNAPTFFLKTLDGKDFYLSDYCGTARQPWKKQPRKQVVLSFFATYCLPCIKEIPLLEKLAEEWKNEVEVTLINVKEDRNRVSAFATAQQIKLPILLDPYGVVGQKYLVNGLPSLFMINTDGKIKYIQRGFNDELMQRLRKVRAQEKE